MSTTVYNGKTYREVKRKAHVGELCKAVKPWLAGADYFDGEVFVVKHSDGNDVTDGRVAGYLTHNICYVVLEPVDNESDVNPLVEALASLEARVKALEEQRVIGCATYVTLEPGERVIPVKPKYTRELAKKRYTRAQIIEMAKKDVEVLLKTVTYRPEGEKLWSPFNRTGKDFRFVINREKRTVVALETYYHGTVKNGQKGISHCAPDDCFNVHIGKAIALRRALGLDVPDYYVNAPKPTEVNVGDVVEVDWLTLRGIIRKRLVIVKDNASVEFGKSAVPGSLFSNECTIIDDSHDFGGEGE